MSAPGTGGDLAAAIATITFSRETHQQWHDWLLEHPDDERAGAVGNPEYHAKAIEEYDNVLACLDALAALREVTP